MNEEQITTFIKWFIGSYQHLEDAVTTIEQHFPPDEEMLKICIELLPELKTDV